MLCFFLIKGKLPADGWNDLSIRQLLNEVALMDSNNFPSMSMIIFKNNFEKYFQQCKISFMLCMLCVYY